MSKFYDKFNKVFRKCANIWVKALSADLFIFITAVILLLYTLFVPNFLIILALILLFVWAILF